MMHTILQWRQVDNELAQRLPPLIVDVSMDAVHYLYDFSLTIAATLTGLKG